MARIAALWMAMMVVMVYLCLGSVESMMQISPISNKHQYHRYFSEYVKRQNNKINLQQIESSKNLIINFLTKRVIWEEGRAWLKDTQGFRVNQGYVNLKTRDIKYHETTDGGILFEYGDTQGEYSKKDNKVIIKMKDKDKKMWRLVFETENLDKSNGKIHIKMLQLNYHYMAPYIALDNVLTDHNIFMIAKAEGAHKSVISEEYQADDVKLSKDIEVDSDSKIAKAKGAHKSVINEVNQADDVKLSKDIEVDSDSKIAKAEGAHKSVISEVNQADDVKLSKDIDVHSYSKKVTCPEHKKRGKRATNQPCPSPLGNALVNGDLLSKDKTILADMNRDLNEIKKYSDTTSLAGTESNGHHRNPRKLFNLKKVGEIMGKVANFLESFSAVAGLFSMFFDIIGGNGESNELIFMKSQFSAVQRKLDGIGLQLHGLSGEVAFYTNAATLIQYENTIDACFAKYITVTDELDKIKLVDGKMNSETMNKIEYLVKLLENQGLETAMQGLFQSLTKGYHVTENHSLLGLFASKSQYHCPAILDYGIRVYSELIDGIQALQFMRLFRGEDLLSGDPWVKKLRTAHLEIYTEYAKCTRYAGEHALTDLQVAVNKKQSSGVLRDRLDEKYVVYKWAVIKCPSTLDVKTWHYRDNEIQYKSPETDEDDAVYSMPISWSLEYMDQTNDGVIQEIKARIFNYCNSLLVKICPRVTCVTKKVIKKVNFDDFMTGVLGRIGDDYRKYIAAISRIETSTTMDSASLQGWDINKKCYDYIVLVLLKTPVDEVDPCISCQHGTCLRLTKINSHENDTYCYCDRGYNGTSCDVKIDHAPVNDTFMQNMKSYLKLIHIPSMYDLAYGMEEINANINQNKHEIISHINRTQALIFENRHEMNKTAEVVIDHITIGGRKVETTIKETTDQIMNEINGQSAHLENNLAELGANLNISIESLKSTFRHIIQSIKKDVMSQAEKVEKNIVDTILHKASENYLLHDSIIGTVELTKNHDSQQKLRYWINEYLEIRKDKSNSIMTNIFIKNFLCDLDQFRQSLNSLKEMLVGSSISKYSIWYLMDVLKYPKCQKDYHDALHTYRTVLLDRLAASYAVIVWALDVSTTIDPLLIRCRPFIKKKRIELEQVRFATKLKSFWSHASCPAFTNKNLIGGGCALYDSKPGLQVKLQCQLREDGNDLTPISTITLQPELVVVCQKDYQWNIDATLITCLGPCVDGDGRRYTVGVDAKPIQKRVGFQAINHLNSPVESIQCIARRTSNSIISSFEFDERFIDINECDSRPCKHGRCINYVGSYQCKCNPGYMRGSSKACEVDIDECKTSDNCKNGQCINTMGSYKCRCNQHYIITTDGLNCQPREYCKEKNGGCQHTCIERSGSVNRCTCRKGYSISLRNPSLCMDVNECTIQDSCPRSHGCRNTKGSFVCVNCPKGYKGNGKICLDINECQTWNNCDINAQCHNTRGSYTCRCKPEFVGNGISCRKDGGWSQWGNWIEWEKCGLGTKKRTRTCNEPKPSPNGKPCSGNATDSRLAFGPACPECVHDSTCKSNQVCIENKCKGVCCPTVKKCRWHEKCVEDGARKAKCVTWYGTCEMGYGAVFKSCTSTGGRCHSWWTGRAASLGWNCFCYGTNYRYWSPPKDSIEKNWGIWGCGKKDSKMCGGLTAKDLEEPKAGSTWNC